MPNKLPRNPSPGPIDGIRRAPRQTSSSTAGKDKPQSRESLASGHALSERPLPKGLSMGHGNALKLSASAPHRPNPSDDVVSHPSLPQPSARQIDRKSTKFSLWQLVIGKSYRVAHDKRSSLAILIATALSPTFWLFVISPWIVTSFLSPGGAGGSILATTIRRLLDLSFIGISWRALLLGLGLFLIWVGRHALLLVSHAVHVRQIDHRLADGHAFWWSAIHKLSRSFSLAIIDGFLASALFGAFAGTTVWIASHHNSANLLYEGLLVNGLLLVAALVIIILSVHRPLARVMLATTNLPARQLVKYSFGMIIYNFGRTLIIGIWWLLMLMLTLALLIGISWATFSYSLGALPHGLMARILLAMAAAILMYIVLAVFLLWNQGFWSLAYHYLAHRTYPAQVSRFFTTDPHRARKRVSLLRVALVAVGFTGIIAFTIYIARGPLSRGWERVQSTQPTIERWLEQ